jgi:hypothetical protein
LFRIVIIHSRLIGLQVLSFDYLVFSFYRTNEYYLVGRGCIITGTKTIGVLIGAGTTIGTGTTGVVTGGTTIGFGTTGVVTGGTTIGFGTTTGAGAGADAALTNAKSASATDVVLIITLFSCVC